MTVRTAKFCLSIGWLILALPLIGILVMRQLNGFYGPDPKDVWGWFSQFVLPGLTLLAGAWTVSAAPNDGKPLENPVVFWVAVILSVFYLGLLYLIVADQFGASNPLDMLKQSALFLGIVQGLLIGLLGKFFIESGR